MEDESGVNRITVVGLSLFRQGESSRFGFGLSSKAMSEILPFSKYPILSPNRDVFMLCKAKSWIRAVNASLVERSV